MKKKQILKVATDILMTAALLLLMAYSLIGEAAHEWIGVALFFLLDYTAIMGLFVCLGHYTTKWIFSVRRKQNEDDK